MRDYLDQGFTPFSDFVIGIDSDGCVFDSMGAKHRDAFIPAAVEVWRLEEWEHLFAEDETRINLYSESRGVNRFEGIYMTFERFMQRPEVESCERLLRDLETIRSFLQSGAPLSNAGLREFMTTRSDETLRSLLRWSERSDELFAKHSGSIQPFDGVSRCLKKAGAFADLVVISAAPHESLREDWDYAGLLSQVRWVAGQEVGSKHEQIRSLLDQGYAKEKVLILGDSPGDLVAAMDWQVCFYPIVPRREVESWNRLHESVLYQFRCGRYVGDHERERFTQSLSGFGST